LGGTPGGDHAAIGENLAGVFEEDDTVAEK
jgi:hypothetical protein